MTLSALRPSCVTLENLLALSESLVQGVLALP